MFISSFRTHVLVQKKYSPLLTKTKTRDNFSFYFILMIFVSAQDLFIFSSLAFILIPVFFTPCFSFVFLQWNLTWLLTCNKF